MITDNLYPCFHHWYRGGNIWLYSDPHFNDPEMKYLRKDYIGDEEQVKRINSKVGKKDTIIFLGDIGDLSYISKIRGYKVLIAGNHDTGLSKYQKATHIVYEIKINGEKKSFTREELNKQILGSIIKFEDFTGVEKCNMLFDEIYTGPLLIADNILLSHERIDNFPYAVNFHGHDHSQWSENDDLHINFCAEHIDYYPQPLMDYIKSGILKNAKDIHRITIDNATKKKFKKENKNGK